MIAIEALIRGHSALELFLAVVAIVGLPAMSAYMGARVLRAPLDTHQLQRRYLATMTRGALIALAVILVWVAGRRSFAELGLGWPPGPAGAIGLAFAAAATVMLAVQLARFSPQAAEIASLKQRIEAVKLAPRNGAEFAAFTPVAIMAGIWEEIFYRGFLLWFLAPALGPWGAALASSAIFGAGHAYQGWRGVLRTAFVGLIFSTGFLATNSLWWLMMLHAVIDLYAGLLSWRVYSLDRARGGRA